MKLLILLLIAVGAAAGSVLPNVNSPIKFGFCKNPPVKPDFKIEQFFSNRWYIWKSYGNMFFETSGTCSGTTSNVIGNKIYLLHYQFQPLISRYISLLGEAEVTFTEFEGLRFPVNYSLFNRFNVSVPYSIVGTDYDNWAVVYFCHQLLGMKIEMSWVMTRERMSSPDIESIPFIKRTLGTIQLDSDNFVLEDNTKCGHDEPHL